MRDPGQLDWASVQLYARAAVAAGGAVTYQAVGDDASFAARAAVKYPTLSPRLTRDDAASLPCTLRLKRG